MGNVTTMNTNQPSRAIGKVRFNPDWSWAIIISVIMLFITSIGYFGWFDYSPMHRQIARIASGIYWIGVVGILTHYLYQKGK